ncbi:MAG TPA: fibronectin type III domain-containing protein [Chryseolinea sp.]
MRPIVFILFLFALAQPLAAQKKVQPADTLKYERSLHLLGKFYGDSVVLRWAPADPLLWKAYNTAGYVIERMEIKEKMTTAPIREKLNAVPIKPWTLEEWKAKARHTDTTAAIAVQLLYGKSNIPEQKAGKGRKANDVNLGDAINQKYDRENRFAMALLIADNSASAANGLGLRFVDKTMQKGKRYVYSIHALTDPAKIKSDSGAVVIKTTQRETAAAMPDIRYEERDRQVIFRWDRAFATLYFTSYNIERSDDGGKTFKRRNHRPYVQPESVNGDPDGQIIYNDSLPKNYKPYFYRITGITPFGDLGMPSPNIPVMGRDKTAPSPPLSVAAQHLGKRKVKLTWQKTTRESDFAGFMVGRSESVNGPFAPLTLKPLGKETVSYIDTTAVPWGTNYYVVSAIDTARNTGISVPAYVIMTDTLAPAKPVGLLGKIDTTGIVHVKWTLGKERDLMGYLVYRANAKDHKFVPITKNFIADSTFTDSLSLKTLTEKIYYRIVAFDKNKNPSAYSDMLELKKPDKVAPVAPVFIKFVVSDTTVALSWVASNSADATTQTLYRREPGGVWTEVARLKKDSTRFTDTKVKKLTWYEYTLIANDDDGNRSERSFPLKVRVYDSGMRQKIEGFLAKVNTDKKSVGLSWKYPATGDYYFLVYRSVNGSGLEMYQQVAGDKYAFADTNVPKGTYEYAVKAIYRDGGQSLITKNMKVEIK